MNPIVDIARSCLGTPYHHQGRLKGIGLDCVGLLVQIAVELELDHFDKIGYSSSPTPGVLVSVLSEQMDTAELEDMREGDVIVMRIGAAIPQHVGVLSRVAGVQGVDDLGAMVHVHARAGKVIEVNLTRSVLDRVTHVFRFRGL